MGRALDVYEQQQNSEQIFNSKLDGVRRVGRPKTRWEDGVDQAMRRLEVQNWKKVALDRDEWVKLLKTRQGPPRAVEPMMMISTTSRLPSHFLHCHTSSIPSNVNLQII
jgi:hypothetical protein